MSRPTPTPRDMADQYFGAVKDARLRQEKIGVHFAGAKKGVGEMLTYPADHFAEDICQPEERHKILHLRKALGSLIDLAESQQQNLSLLCQLLEMAAGNVKEQQSFIDAQALRIEQLEMERNG
ncbi:hypothetical protein [Botrimarina mediterranea]|uniref:hypothetical protein n=1 Tax=Botrimarina mediterranea TaxID=2528022 RepID=UPI0011877D31|nr:hypothetical protein K2D_34810 [Planctomycetes bacterium K2D]